MEFKLLYSGRLLGASKSNTRASEKHAIRKEFHPQLRRLWATHHNLIDLALLAGSQHIPYSADKSPIHADVAAKGLNYLAKWELSGHKFPRGLPCDAV